MANEALGVIDNVAGGLSGGFGSYTTAPWWPALWFWVKFAGWMIVFIFGALVWWKFFKQYNVRIGLRIKSGGGVTELKDDKAKIVTDEHGKRKLVLFKTRKGGHGYTCPVPPTIHKLKKGKLDYYDLLLDDNDQMHPVGISFKDRVKALYSKDVKERIVSISKENEKLVDGKLEYIDERKPTEEASTYLQARPQDRDSWVLDELKLKQERTQKKSWMQEYMPLIVITTLSITVILTFFFLFQNIGTGMSSLANSFRSIAQNCVGI